MTTVGVIADTHGLLRSQAEAALEGSDLILHAGDVGDPTILTALARLAPVRAVRGNVDKSGPCSDLPESDVAEVGPILIYLLHDIARLDLDPGTVGFRVVVTGHSHRPSQEDRDGVLFFNPGSAGPRRFKLPVTLGRLRIEGSLVRSEVVELEV